MEDNPSSDDEVNKSPISPKMGGKKLKLNDGSSQESLKDSGSSSKAEKDENVDSGVSADKSESTSSDDRVNGAVEGPSNEVVNVAPSSSNVRAILLNIRRPKRGRNYRKRKTPGRDSDSNDSSRDSDDLSVEETVLSVRQDNSNSEGDSDDYQRYLGGLISELSPSGGSSPSTSESNNSYNSDGSDDVVRQSDDTDSDNIVWSRFEDGNSDENNESNVVLKERPKHNYQICREIINREMGLTFPCGKTGKYEVMFEKKFYSSLHSIYRLDKLHYLNEHRGCVNSINFHPEGHLLASGSDDTQVIVWDWARNIALQSIKTGHKSNVFQSKFLYLNAESQLNIVTCARDGQVRLLQCPPSGGPAVVRRRLMSHARAAHKLHVCASEPHLVVSAAEDGLVMQCDVREDHPTRLFQVRDQKHTIPLYSVCGHPLSPRELLVAGRDKFVRVYDRRKSTKPVLMYCPSTFLHQVKNIPLAPQELLVAGHDKFLRVYDRKKSTKSVLMYRPSTFMYQSGQKKAARYAMMHMTCAVYNHDGSEILGSYNDEDIYLFDAKKDVYDKEDTSGLKDGYTHRYSGHRNSATFKGVAFFGPNSEYVVSGSDCSYIYIWEKKSEAIVQWLKGDENGVVNCIEGHPRCPVLASSGLDRDVKIWWPTRLGDPDLTGLEKQVRENGSKVRSTLFHDFLPTLYTAWRGENLLPDDEERYGGNIDFDGNVCTAF